jgi:hypothetical protein
MFTPGLAIFYSATILRPGHVCGVECHACSVATYHSKFWPLFTISSTIVPNFSMLNTYDYSIVLET